MIKVTSRRMCLEGPLIGRSVIDVRYSDAAEDLAIYIREQVTRKRFFEKEPSFHFPPNELISYMWDDNNNNVKVVAWGSDDDNGETTENDALRTIIKETPRLRFHASGNLDPLAPPVDREVGTIVDLVIDIVEAMEIVTRGTLLPLCDGILEVDPNSVLAFLNNETFIEKTLFTIITTPRLFNGEMAEFWSTASARLNVAFVFEVNDKDDYFDVIEVFHHYGLPKCCLFIDVVKNGVKSLHGSRAGEIIKMATEAGFGLYQRMYLPLYQYKVGDAGAW